MRRLGRRVATITIGVSLLAFYVGVAYVGYGLLVALWAVRPDPIVAVVGVGSATLLSGYLSYRLGTASALARLEAVELPRERAPGIHARLDRLCDRMDVERPRLFVARLAVPNALSLGGVGDGVVVVDRSLFRLLDGDELEAILAHELAHLENRDALVQTMAYSAVKTVVAVVAIASLPFVVVAAGIGRAFAWIRGAPAARDAEGLDRFHRRIGQALLVVSVGLTLVLFAHSRWREYAADDRAAAVTGDPVTLARALVEIERATNPAWSLLAPLSVSGDEEGVFTRMLSTHPTTEERVERLLGRVEGGRSGAR